MAPVAVVSALHGRTDALARACDAERPRLSAYARAARLCAGERECAALLVDELRRGGLLARLADPLAVQMRAVGDPLDAMPKAMSLPALQALLAAAPAVVVPGFFAADEAGRTVLLGRGGSDLTALFLAERLGCGCELVKDTGGLLPASPRAAQDPLACGLGQQAPLATASDAELLQLGPGLVQTKAVRFAAARGLAFWIRGLRGGPATRIGPEPWAAGQGDVAHG